MRLSIDESDPGYEKYVEIGACFANVSVTVDGVKKLCITADDEKGEALVYIPQEDPRFKMAMAQGCNIWPTELLKGVVVIKVER